MKRLIPVLALVAAGCVGDHNKALDVTQGYDSFGTAITPEDAVPVQAVLAEGASLIGQEVKLEGRISEVCEMAGCWLTMQVVDGPMIRIDVPRDENGAYVFTFPKDASGRRAVIAGVLEGDRDHHDADGGDHHAGSDADGMAHHDGGDHDNSEDGEPEMIEGHSDQETRALNESAYTLTATGALVERVRA